MSDADEARLAAALSGNPIPSSEEKDTPKDTDVAGDAPSSPSKPQPRDKEHQLETPWTLYFDKKLAGTVDYKNFEENLQKLGQFNTLEGFWKHFAFMARPDTLPKDYNLFLFRHNYIPAWETFPNGGCWIIKVRKHNGLINRLWEELVFACIGELFEEPHIAGVALSTRAREDVLSIWNRDNTRYPEIRFKIGEKLREILNLDSSTQVEYKDFSSSLRDGSTYRNAKPYVYAANNDGQQQTA